MRNIFIKKLDKFTKKDNNIFLLTADLGFKLFDDFRRLHPENFINVGIAETNMISIASGLALSGKNVYCYSMIPFLTLRSLEQIRVDLCYNDLNVKLVGVGGGLVYGLEGMTHQATEDISIMRSLPNMAVVAPGDPMEVAALFEESVKYKGPLYIRLGKNGDPCVHKTMPDFKIGKGITIYKGNDITILATGNMLNTAKIVSDALIDKGLSIELISMHTIKPLDKKLIVNCAKKTKAIFTIEEHSIIGGLGSAVAEVLAELNCKIFFRRVALEDKYAPDIGGAEYLRSKFSLTPELIKKRILKEIKNINF